MNLTEDTVRFFFVILFLVTTVSIGADWVHPVHDGVTAPTYFLFSPGLFQNETAICRYCTYYCSSEKDYFICEHATNLINACHCTAINFAEIFFKIQDNESYSVRLMSDIVSRLLTIMRNIRHFSNPIYKIRSSCNNQPLHHMINIKRVNVGQECDIDLLSKYYDDVVNRLAPQQAVVLYGFSRGAVTIFNFLCTKYREKADKRVGAVVLEACFDTFKNSLYHVFPTGKKLGLCDTILQVFCLLFPEYKVNGMEPRDMLGRFPHDIPILFVTSKKDEIVPFYSVKNLYKRLRFNGYSNVYYCELNDSSHSRYTATSACDVERYTSAVHSFYRQYNLSYCL